MTTPQRHIQGCIKENLKEGGMHTDRTSVTETRGPRLNWPHMSGT